MASEVDICNLSLGYLGDAANLQSISPPDGSAQADHAARFYPVARDSLLEMHTWSFATKRATLAQLSGANTLAWGYAYTQPNDLLTPISVLDPNAQDDLSVGISYPSQWRETPLPRGGIYTPQEYQLETAADGTEIVLTNQGSAVMRYVARVTDTSKFSTLFIQTLARSLASMLAGPVIKGDAGVSVSAKQQMIAFGQDGKSGIFGKAVMADAGDRRSNFYRDRQMTPWLNGR